MAYIRLAHVVIVVFLITASCSFSYFIMASMILNTTILILSAMISSLFAVRSIMESCFSNTLIAVVRFILYEGEAPLRLALIARIAFLIILQQCLASVFGMRAIYFHIIRFFVKSAKLIFLIAPFWLTILSNEALIIIKVTFWADVQTVIPGAFLGICNGNEAAILAAIIWADFMLSKDSEISWLIFIAIVKVSVRTIGVFGCYECNWGKF